jgi:hypothetical protein
MIVGGVDDELGYLGEGVLEQDVLGLPADQRIRILLERRDQGAQPARGGAAVVVEKRDEAPLGDAHAVVARRGGAAVRLPREPHRELGATARDHLFDGRVSAVVHDDDLQARGRIVDPGDGVQATRERVGAIEVGMTTETELASSRALIRGRPRAAGSPR